MGAALFAVLALAAADPVVTALPLTAGEGVSKDAAAGVDVVWRERIAAAGFVRLLDRVDKDAESAFRCGVDPGCLGPVAKRRGADLLLAGRVDEDDEGFLLQVVVVEPGATEALREVTQPVRGTRDNMEEWLDRAVRLALRPRALAGALLVTGHPKGATVYVDGAIGGQLPFEEPLTGVVEGEHQVRVEMEGFAPYQRTVDVTYRDVKMLQVVLRPLDETGADAPELSVLWDVTPWVVVGLGGALVAGGAVAGGISWLDAIEVERRAELGHLVLPRDADLLSRGALLATTANVLYLSGAALALGGVGLWVAGRVLAPAPVRDEYVAPAEEGAPDWEELRPGLD